MPKPNGNDPKPKPPHNGKIHQNTNLTRKTDAKSGYKHGSLNSHRKDKK